MANAIYAVKVLRVDGLAIDLELKATLDEHVYCWPSLAVRALADGPGSPLAALDLATFAGVAAAAAAWIERVEVLATRKGVGQYRIVARRPGLADKLKKGTAWPSNALHVDNPRHIQGVLIAGGKLAALVVDPGSPVASGAVELLAVTKKGPGATRGWLNHVGVRGVSAAPGQLLSWSADQVRVWDEAGALLAEIAAAPTCACLTPHGPAIGTADGVILGEATLALGPVRALAYEKDRLHALLASGELVILAGAAEERRFAAVHGATLAVSPARDELVIAGDDGLVHVLRDGKRAGAVENRGYRGRTVHDTAALPGGVAISGIHEAFLVHADGRVAELGRFDAHKLSAAGGLVMSTSYGDVVRARLWRDDGAPVGGLVLPRSNLHRAQFASRPHPTRLTWNGDWVLCAEAEHEGGAVRLTGTRGQGQVRFENPRADYDFITDVAQVGPASFLVGYGNHEAVLWHLDGTSRVLNFRLDEIFHRDGLLLTSTADEVTEWDADFKRVRKFKVDVPYSLHWLEASGDGRLVIAGAQPRAWIFDRQTGEQWEVTQAGGVNDPTFAGHPRRFTTATMDSDHSVLHVWDALERRMIKSLPEPHATQRVVWLSEHTLLTVAYDGVFVHDLRGDRRAVLNFPPVDQVRDPQLSIGYDAKGQLFTVGERSHLRLWDSAGRGKTTGGSCFGPAIFEFTPGWCIAMDQWPARAVRTPG